MNSVRLRVLAPLRSRYVSRTYSVYIGTTEADATIESASQESVAMGTDLVLNEFVQEYITFR